MERPTILEIARKVRGWTQTQLATAAGTSQATVSAYERREKSPSLGVIERLVGEAGYTLRLDHTVDFTEFFDGQTVYWIPDRLWRVEPRLCFSKVKFPDAVAHRESGEWQQRYFDLADRDDRRRVYQYLLGAGIPVWIWRWVDGALLVDLWDELDLPRQLRAQWQPLIDHTRNGAQEDPIHVGVDHAHKQAAEERKERIAARRAAARADLQH
ncbi:MAG: helix-turn-helix transcriptional regulator [Nocardioidaceae bacterium]|nr:helix-turn-helix transcriptional regulator [Nocardioidaceae bacterium]